MKIEKNIYDKIISKFRFAKIESGGILGETNGVITAFYFDSMAKSGRGEYIPNVEKLNRTIETWAQEDIRFVGMIHSHPNAQSFLSEHDKRYAETIFYSNQLKMLYFPVVIYVNGEPKIFVYQYDGTWRKGELSLT